MEVRLNQTYLGRKQKEVNLEFLKETFRKLPLGR
jgi:hypothetical protein